MLWVPQGFQGGVMGLPFRPVQRQVQPVPPVKRGLLVHWQAFKERFQGPGGFRMIERCFRRRVRNQFAQGEVLRRVRGGWNIQGECIF